MQLHVVDMCGPIQGRIGTLEVNRRKLLHTTEDERPWRRNLKEKLRTDLSTSSLEESSSSVDPQFFGQIPQERCGKLSPRIFLWIASSGMGCNFFAYSWKLPACNRVVYLQLCLGLFCLQLELVCLQLEFFACIGMACVWAPKLTAREEAQL